MANRLLLLRHAPVTAQYAGKLIGSTDVPLAGLGEMQSRRLADRVARWKPQACFSSPMQRCRQTAEAAAVGLPFHVDPDLREIDFGRCECRTFAEAAAEDPGLSERWAAFTADFGFPGGEKLECFLGRVRAAACRLAHADASTVLAVTHGGVIRAMICHLLGLEARHYLAFDVPYTALAVIDLFDGKGVLTALEQPDAAEVGHG
jgi:alpha-ribazole phosphatase